MTFVSFFCIIYVLYMILCITVCLIDQYKKNKTTPTISGYDSECNNSKQQALTDYMKKMDYLYWEWIDSKKDKVRFYVEDNRAMLCIVKFGRTSLFNRRMTVKNVLPLTFEDFGEKSSQDASQSYYAALIANNHKLFQELSELINVDGPLWINATALNNEEIPTNSEMKAIVAELETLGFKECGIDYCTGKVKLGLQ